MKVAKGQTNVQKNLVSLYWDWQNVRVSSHQANGLLNFASVQGDLCIKKVYAYWRRENQRIEEALYNLNFDCLNIPSFTKNSVDHKLIADCKLEVLNNPAIIAILTLVRHNIIQVHQL
ncbi:NYN domain-containing protein [Microcoleus sp. FACHB-SPT15]|uniref:NYN domain-containing protein n=1 Tax=Microcoleus sp. FACHB-SPT15 TaxID=2692830 RepID=UPI001780469E|nr:NYN domain-containing protein [Microcoleus sp. FACHB-SPT15]MBD1804673.1 NYN domain-containing protein [Microcoleus sp. FACHB-SPT15]